MSAWCPRRSSPTGRDRARRSGDPLARLLPVGEEQLQPLVGQRVVRPARAARPAARSPHRRRSWPPVSRAVTLRMRGGQDLRCRGRDSCRRSCGSPAPAPCRRAPASSRRPTNGEMKVAPALAASSAWLAEKHSVTLTMVPSPVSAWQALRPSQVSGTLTVTLPAILASARPSSEHAVEVGGGDLGADRPRHQLADLGDDLLEVAAGLGHQGRIGGDAVEQARCGQLLDLGHIRRIDEELHGRPSTFATYGPAWGRLRAL